MIYENLINTIVEINENDKIEKKGLSLTYELDNLDFDNISRELHEKTYPSTPYVRPNKGFEVKLGDFIVKFYNKVDEKE